MEKLWQKIKQSVVEGVSTAAEKTGEYTKIGKAKLDVLSVKRKISKQFTELGGIVYDAVKEKKSGEVLDTPEAKEIINTLKDIEKELREKEDAFEKLKTKTEPEKKENSKNKT